MKTMKKNPRIDCKDLTKNMISSSTTAPVNRRKLISSLVTVPIAIGLSTQANTNSSILLNPIKPTER
jgi:hypothetical protein